MGIVGRLDRLRNGGQQDNDNAFILFRVFQFITQSVAVFPRHHDIQDDQVGTFFLDLIHGFQSVICLGYPELFAFQLHGDHFHEIGIVIHHKNKFTIAHVSLSSIRYIG
ncbi:MAG: hypothetical protein ACD_75C01093G0003 [uncultured bacterium]|nr:MAG: hypothetical protein ACD_75C01093G0003 [uncultured bacterium]